MRRLALTLCYPALAAGLLLVAALALDGLARFAAWPAFGCAAHGAAIVALHRAGRGA